MKFTFRQNSQYLVFIGCVKINIDVLVTLKAAYEYLHSRTHNHGCKFFYKYFYKKMSDLMEEIGNLTNRNLYPYPLNT